MNLLNIFKSPKAICIFCPGILIPPQFIGWSLQIKLFFWLRGYDLRVADMPLAGSIKDRAALLAPQIQALLAGKDLHVIGHSMGGLDARLALSVPAFGQVKSLTTISSPHKGSQVADALMGTNPPSLNPNPWQASGADLTTESMKVFNKTVANNMFIQYFSMGFQEPEIYGLLDPGWHIINDAGFSQNDGMVSVDSSMWGKYLGTFTGAHIYEVNPFLWNGQSLWQTSFGAVLDNLDAIFY